ncbi:MAG: SpoIID/LytB domain-containing protein [Trueperaceae bacterium]
MVALLSLLASVFAQAVPSVRTQVRVLLASAPSVMVGADGAHRGSVDGVPRFATAFGLAWPVVVRDGRLVVDGHEVGARLTIEGDGSFVLFDGRRFRGAITLRADGDMVEVLNVLDIESYLRGVVPSEMSASWPMEALKAQAVAARSYTLASLDPGGRYDLCATVDCQVYRGVVAEHARTDAAVSATAGVVVTYQGITAKTYYHSDSGGVVASSQEVWGAPSPYLVAMQDVAAITPHRSWSSRLDGAALGASLRSVGIDVGTVQGLRVVRLSESGRVLELEVHGTAGMRVLRGFQLRTLARGWGLRSMRFQVQGGLTVRGDGWGHGVGMSQYGARALASSGYDYSAILAFYYPSTGLTRFVAQAP